MDARCDKNAEPNRSPSCGRFYAAFFREEELWLRLEELPVRDEDEPRPLVVVLLCVLPRPDEDDEEELRRPELMLLVFELRLELPEPALREDVAEVREERLPLRPLACSSSG